MPIWSILSSLAWTFLGLTLLGGALTLGWILVCSLWRPED